MSNQITIKIQKNIDRAPMPEIYWKLFKGEILALFSQSSTFGDLDKGQGAIFVGCSQMPLQELKTRLSVTREKFKQSEIVLILNAKEKILINKDLI